jgi:hypothetical protein
MSDEKKLNLEIDPTQSIRLDTPPVTAAQASAFEDDLQRQMPPGWKLTAIFERQGEHHQLIGYRIEALGEVLNLGTYGETDVWHEGWTIQLIGGAFFNEFIVAAPDGTTAIISDILLA